MRVERAMTDLSRPDFLCDPHWLCGARVCVSADCPLTLTQTGFNFYINSVTVGSVADYNCQSGYVAGGSGNAYIECQADSTWSSPARTCTGECEMFEYVCLCVSLCLCVCRFAQSTAHVSCFTVLGSTFYACACPCPQRTRAPR